MPVDKKGEEILRKAQFNKFKEALIESLMKKISMGGKYGKDLRSLVEETLEEAPFVQFVNDLRVLIEKESNLEKKHCDKTAEALVEEKISGDIKNILRGQIDEDKDFKKSVEDKEIEKEGWEHRLWKGPISMKLLGGKRKRREDISRLFKNNPILKIPIFLGLLFLLISALLFESPYRALVVGLTLTTFPGESLKIMIANVIGGLGGILLFFTSVTILLEYILINERRNMYLQETAREFLRRKE